MSSDKSDVQNEYRWGYSRAGAGNDWSRKETRLLVSLCFLKTNIWEAGDCFISGVSRPSPGPIKTPKPANQGLRDYQKLPDKCVWAGWSKNLQDVGPPGAELDTGLGLDIEETSLVTSLWVFFQLQILLMCSLFGVMSSTVYLSLQIWLGDKIWPSFYCQWVSIGLQVILLSKT